ncbi:AAA family ATPase [Vibrio phage vB_VhaP_PG11]|nr:AAA family ATPase [Vibrio phage vB_VhaP_PG11]
MSKTVNDNLILVVGKSSTGKSMCLKDLRDHEGVLYLNCESGKKLPFKNNFKRVTVTDPMMVPQAFQQAEQMSEIHTIVVDSITYLMEMYETRYVKTSSNTLQAWGEYADFFKNLMMIYVASSTKNVIMTAHTADIINEDMVKETLVKVKGSLMNNGIESWFSQIVACKKMPLKKLTGYQNELLTISSRDERLKFKHVFQTELTEDTTNERIRSPFGMWAEDEDCNETFIDNNIQAVLDRINTYYN